MLYTRKGGYNMDILQRIENLTTRHFRPIWEDCDRQAAFKLCNYTRKRVGVPEYSEEKFDEGFRYRTIFHEDYKEAKEEFINLVFGWW